MNKKFIIEQCRRLDSIHRKESEEVELENDLDCKWILVHNQGHKDLIDRFEKFLGNTHSTDKKDYIKWLKKNMKEANNIIKSLDEKYNNFYNDEIMSEKDDVIYNLNVGIVCISNTLLDVIYKRRYISKIKIS